MEKETVTKFNLEAAFKALDEIDMPKAPKGRLQANRVNLHERFQAKSAHDRLIEDYFDVNDVDDLEAAKEEREAEVAKAKLARIEKIVDLDAETEEDILPSYVGKVIMQCPQCMTLFYKNEEDIEKSEETPDVVNINELCQHCGNASGYTLVGKVGGIEESEAENFDLDGIDIEAEDNELNLDFPEEGTEEIDAEGVGEGAEEMSDEDFDFDLDFEEESEEEEEEEPEEANESLHNSELLDKIEDKNDLKTDIESEHLTLNEKFDDNENTESEEDAVIESVHNSELLKKIEDKSELKSEEESECLTLNEDIEANQEYYIFIDQSGTWRGEKDKLDALVDKDFKDHQGELHVSYFDDFEFKDPLLAAKEGKNVVIYTDEDCNANCPELGTMSNVTIKDCTVVLNSDKNKVFTEESLTEDAYDALLDKLWAEKQPTEAETRETLATFSENIEAPTATADEPTVANEPASGVKEPGEAEPSEESEPATEPTVAESLDEFDEFDEAFDSHVTNYLQEVYSNIQSYTSTNCTVNKSKFVVEGIIKFKSGKEKATKFTFNPSRKINGAIIFRGMNEGLTSEKSAFRLACKTEDKKLVTEGFSYKYSIDGAAIKGTTKTIRH